MGKVNEEIKKIQVEENMTLPQLFEKYPHLAKLQYEEVKEERHMSEDKNKQLTLLLDWHWYCRTYYIKEACYERK